MIYELNTVTQIKPKVASENKKNRQVTESSG
jgi:hypothetical protein